MKRPIVMRKILSREYVRFTNTPISAKDTVFMTLECGHPARYKGSKEPKGDKANCTTCAFVRQNQMRQKERNENS